MSTLRRIRTGNESLNRVQDAVEEAIVHERVLRVLPTRLVPTIAPASISSSLFVHRFIVPAGATADLDFAWPGGSEEIVDVTAKKTNAAGGGVGTVQVQTRTGGAVTDAMSINVADTTIVRAATLDDARHRFARGDTVRIRRVRTGSSDESCIVSILTLRFA